MSSSIGQRRTLGTGNVSHDTLKVRHRSCPLEGHQARQRLVTVLFNSVVSTDTLTASFDGVVVLSVRTVVSAFVNFFAVTNS